MKGKYNYYLQLLGLADNASTIYYSVGAIIEKKKISNAGMAGKWQCQTGIRKNNAGRLEMRCQNGEKD